MKRDWRKTGLGKHKCSKELMTEKRPSKLWGKIIRKGASTMGARGQRTNVHKNQLNKHRK
jgi:hypothetical protein